MEHITEILGKMELFKGFSTEEMENLIGKSEVRAYSPGETIIRFGQPGTFLGLMLEGEAEAVITNEIGERRRLGIVKCGDLLGEMSLLTGEPTSADVIALAECRLFMVPQETFSAFLAGHPQAVRVMAKTITERLKSRRDNEETRARVENAWRKAPDPYGLGLDPAKPAKVLVVTTGKSSLTFDYFDTARKTNHARGSIDLIGTNDCRIVAVMKGERIERKIDVAGRPQAFAAALSILQDAEVGVLRSSEDLTAIAHKVPHGGDKYGSASVIDDEVLADVAAFAKFSPEGNPASLEIIKVAMSLLPKVPNVAVFDTGFHQNMASQSFLYAIPYDLYTKAGIRRYGAHGITHNYVSLRTAAAMKRNFGEMRIVSCFLDETGSLCAVDHGRAIDISAGFGPIDGLMSSWSPGSIDISVIFHLLKTMNLSTDEVEDILVRRGGLAGISASTRSFQELEDAAGAGNPLALLAIHHYCRQLRKQIGAFIAALGGADTLVFTGEIAERSDWVRGLSTQGLSFAGIEVNNILNKTASPTPGSVIDVSDEHSTVKVLIVPNDEARMIARETIRVLGYENVSEMLRSRKDSDIPIELSAHHVHLSQSDVERLFGPGHELTFRAPLSQPGQYSCEETVNLVGRKGRAERVRVLGPARSKSQVEIAMTEEFKLGIKAPIRASGDISGTPGISLEGPNGSLDLSEGVICSLRHVHMSPEDALSFGVKDRDVVMVKVQGERTLIFGDVLIRVDPDFRLAMHIDTDEANAANIKTGMVGQLISIQDRR